MLLADIIAHLESGNNPERMRFEPGTYSWWQLHPTPARQAILEQIKRLHCCSDETARVIACSSFGRYQILGENLYSVCACTYTVFGLVQHPDVELEMLDRFLRQRGVDFTIEEIVADPLKRRAFIAAYNGPADMDGYWAKMQDAIKHLGGLPCVTQNAPGTTTSGVISPSS